MAKKTSGQFAISGEWAKHLRKSWKRLFWKTERHKTREFINKVIKDEF